MLHRIVVVIAAVERPVKGERFVEHLFTRTVEGIPVETTLNHTGVPSPVVGHR